MMGYLVDMFSAVLAANVAVSITILVVFAGWSGVLMALKLLLVGGGIGGAALLVLHLLDQRMVSDEPETNRASDRAKPKLFDWAAFTIVYAFIMFTFFWKFK